MKLQNVQLQNRGGAHFSYIRSRRCNTLTFVAGVAMIATMMFLLGGLSGNAVASQPETGATGASGVSGVKPKAKPSKQFKRRYAKAKRNMNKCRWGVSYRQFLKMRKQAVKWYGYRAYHNLAVTAVSAGKKKPARRWASRGIDVAAAVQEGGGSVNDVMGMRMLQVYHGSYVVTCPMK